LGLRVEAHLVDAILGGALGDGPTLAADRAERRRSALFGRSFLNYFELAGLGSQDVARAEALAVTAVNLYRRRRRDGDLGNSRNYYGGDFYNDWLIDYHLAAIWRTRGWPTDGMPPDMRCHVEPAGPAKAERRPGVGDL
jgi:hypothetical protein